VRKVDVDYYTDADTMSSMKVLDVFDEQDDGIITRCRGEVLVSTMVKLFKKIKLDTHENLGWGPVTLPELEIQTTACWYLLPEGMEEKYGSEVAQTAMVGLANLLRAIAPLNLMCSPRDVAVVYHARDPFTKRPTVYLYDCMQGGLGLAERIYEMGASIFRQAADMLADCPCQEGCPSCMGASAGEEAKQALTEILSLLSNP